MSTKEKEVKMSAGNLYDINKNAMAQEKPIKKGTDAYKRVKEKAKEYFLKNKMYSMLLCHDKRDYTLFRLTTKEEKNVDNIVEALMDCIYNRGKLKAFEKALDEIAYEVWIEIDKEQYCYYLFPYDSAIIEE